MPFTTIASGAPVSGCGRYQSQLAKTTLPSLGRHDWSSDAIGRSRPVAAILVATKTTLLAQMELLANEGSQVNPLAGRNRAVHPP